MLTFELCHYYKNGWQILCFYTIIFVTIRQVNDECIADCMDCTIVLSLTPPYATILGLPTNPSGGHHLEGSLRAALPNTSLVNPDYLKVNCCGGVMLSDATSSCLFVLSRRWADLGMG